MRRAQLDSWNEAEVQPSSSEEGTDPNFCVLRRGHICRGRRPLTYKGGGGNS